MRPHRRAILIIAAPMLFWLLIWLASYAMYFRATVAVSSAALTVEFLKGITQVELNHQALAYDRNFDFAARPATQAEPWTGNHQWERSGFGFAWDQPDAIYAGRHVYLVAVPFWAIWLAFYLPLPIYLFAKRRELTSQPAASARTG